MFGGYNVGAKLSITKNEISAPNKSINPTGINFGIHPVVRGRRVIKALAYKI